MVPLNQVDCFADAAAADLATFCLGLETADEAAESDDDDDRAFQPQVERDVIHVVAAAAAAADRHESTVVVVASAVDAFAAAVDARSFLVVLDEKM